jgi:hypothetical protein
MFRFQIVSFAVSLNVLFCFVLFRGLCSAFAFVRNTRVVPPSKNPPSHELQEAQYEVSSPQSHDKIPRYSKQKAKIQTARTDHGVAEASQVPARDTTLRRLCNFAAAERLPMALQYNIPRLKWASRGAASSTPSRISAMQCLSRAAPPICKWARIAKGRQI